MSKAWKITISIIASLLILIMGFLAVYYLWPWNKEFFDNAKKEWSIPGLDTSFTPQGLSKIQDQNKFLVSGYMSDGSASRFYVVDNESGEIIKYFTLSVDEREYTGHAGGIVSHGSSVWVVGDKCCYRFTLNDINNVDNGNKVYAKAWFKLEYNNADFVFANDGVLYIGEFYKAGKHETSEKHHMRTRSGEMNTAIVYGFDIDEQEKIGLSDIYPDLAISIRGLCQGMDMTSDGKFVMSTSYSLPDSNIYYYKDVLSEESHGTYRYGYDTIPLWYLDNEALISSTNAPAMSEEVAVHNGNVYILFESASKKYRLINRKRLYNVYSLPISAL